VLWGACSNVSRVAHNPFDRGSWLLNVWLVLAPNRHLRHAINVMQVKVRKN
jgi:hypothetical protein